MSTLVQSEVAVQKDFLPLNGTDHVEFYVGNARQSAYFYRLAFGMRLVAYAGPETGVRDRASYVLQQGKVRFVLTTPLRPDGEIADHVRATVTACAMWLCGSTMLARPGKRRLNAARAAFASPSS